MSKRFLFLALISLMLFVLAIAGQDRPPLAVQLTGTSAPRTSDGSIEKETEGSLLPVSRARGRSPASLARTLDIQPILPGDE